MTFGSDWTTFWAMYGRLTIIDVSGRPTETSILITFQRPPTVGEFFRWDQEQMSRGGKNIFIDRATVVKPLANGWWFETNHALYFLKNLFKAEFDNELPVEIAPPAPAPEPKLGKLVFGVWHEDKCLCAACAPALHGITFFRPNLD